jgi:hypothetical protein
MPKTPTEIMQMCDECKSLVGAHRHILPHGSLTETKFREVKSQFGNVDEYYYICRVCNTNWMRETGSYGEGWI